VISAGIGSHGSLKAENVSLTSMMRPPACTPLDTRAGVADRIEDNEHFRDGFANGDAVRRILPGYTKASSPRVGSVLRLAALPMAPASCSTPIAQLLVIRMACGLPCSRHPDYFC
jgi:hypothetical protein